MKKIILPAIIAGALLFGAAGQAAAQKNRFDSLNLTQVQKKSVDSIMMLYNGKRKSLKAESTLSAEEKAAKLKEINKEQREKIVALLTPEQQQQLQKANKTRPLKEGQ